MNKILLFWLLSISTFLQAQNADTTNSKTTGQIYFLRSTGMPGAATNFKAFIDETLVCKINNDRFSVHDVAPGKHTCSVQFGGKESKKGAEKLEVVVEAGKITYVQVVVKLGVFVNNTYCKLLTDAEGKDKMTVLKPDKSCF